MLEKDRRVSETLSMDIGGWGPGLVALVAPGMAFPVWKNGIQALNRASRDLQIAKKTNIYCCRRWRIKDMPTKNFNAVLLPDMYVLGTKKLPFTR